MAFPLINSWSVGDELTSAQMNAVSADLVKALDKTGDGIASSPTGGISGVIDILHTGSMRLLDVSNNQLITISGTTLNVKNGGSFVTDVGATMTLNADATFNCIVTYPTGAGPAFASGSNAIFGTGATLAMFAGSIASLGAEMTFGGRSYYPPHTVNNNYTVDSGGNIDTIILVDTTTNSPVITLPTPTAGRLLIIKDSTGHAATHNIELSGSIIHNIDGITPYTINKNYGSTIIVADGSNWFILNFPPT